MEVFLRFGGCVTSNSDFGFTASSLRLACFRLLDLSPVIAAGRSGIEGLNVPSSGCDSEVLGAAATGAGTEGRVAGKFEDGEASAEAKGGATDGVVSEDLSEAGVKDGAGVGVGA